VPALTRTIPVVELAPPATIEPDTNKVPVSAWIVPVPPIVPPVTASVELVDAVPVPLIRAKLVFDADPSDTPFETDKLVDGDSLRVVDFNAPAVIVNELTTADVGSNATVSAALVLWS